VKVGDGWLMTPTNSCMGRLDPARISRLDANGKLLSGDKPSKEAFLHVAMYRERAGAGAVVHLHSVHAVAVSCLADIDPLDVFPPVTAYAVMQLGKLALAPYFPPGDEGLAAAVGKLAGKHHAILLANHGPVVSGSSLDAAVNAVEELEQTAKLMLLLRGQAVRHLNAAQVDELNRRFAN
jgi:3-dehydro-4-phosphotetronate decarboxylase